MSCQDHTNSKLTNTTGTSSKRFSLDKMVIEYIGDGENTGARLTFPNGVSPIYLRALNPNVTTKWINGKTLPSESEGNNGDYFLNAEDGSIYYKEHNFWKLMGSAMGPQGPKGDTGNIGPTGPTGPTGPQGPAASFSNASDVELNNLEHGQLITYNAVTGKFVNVPRENITDGGNI